MKAGIYFVLLICIVLSGCSLSKNYNADKKYPKEKLQQDYTLLRNILEKKHPSLYWYTSKDSMDYYFDEGYKNISDSMTELQFGWKILAPLTNKIHCGHTSFSMSKGWNKFIRDKRIPSFPLYLKIWKDTMMVTDNINRKDSVIKKGMFITSINGIKNKDLINKMSGYVVQDGYEDNVNYIRFSTSFPYFHRNIFGIYKNYSVEYLDSAGVERKAMVPLFGLTEDTLKKIKNFPPVKQKRITRKEKLESVRSLQTNDGISIMTINSFSDGSHLKKFFRRSFRYIRKNNIKHLVIDIRANGGGDISNYVRLTKYIRNINFKVADTTAAISKNFAPYTKYIKSGFLNNIALFFLTGKKTDGRYHFGYWERHTMKPKTNNHFSGDVFVLTNGLTFSASSLFCNSVKGQDNVSLVGENTGGGWHGNSGIMIPDITLPNTKLRVRLPFFRIVQYQHIPKTGTGVIPDIYIGPSSDALKNDIDRKMEFVKKLIKEKEAK
ncbi:MAG: S41 family peptidase [Thermoproteota archaeon]|nr:S41 family peptidase [Thermoproteota archaeon]